MGYSFHSLLFLPAYYLYGSRRVGASYLIYYLFHSLHIILVNAFPAIQVGCLCAQVEKNDILVSSGNGTYWYK